MGVFCVSGCTYLGDAGIGEHARGRQAPRKEHDTLAGPALLGLLAAEHGLQRAAAGSRAGGRLADGLEDLARKGLPAMVVVRAGAACIHRLCQ